MTLGAILAVREAGGFVSFYVFDFAFYPKGTIHLFQGFLGGSFFQNHHDSEGTCRWTLLVRKS